MREGTTLAVGFRHGICLLIGAMWLAFPPRPVPVAIATVVLMVWSAIRLWDRRAGPVWVTADLLVLAAYLAVPANEVATSVSAIGGTTQLKLAFAVIISFGIEQRVRWSAVSLAVLLAALYVGFRNVPDLAPDAFLSKFTVQYLFVLWAMAVGARLVVLRAADGVDVSREALARTRVLAAVTGARRRYEREQMALMHDTAASTLLMVSTGGVADGRALAVQARRDLAVLEAGVPVFDENDVDLVGLLADVASDCRTPSALVGLTSLRVRQAVAWAVTSAVREALTNVDRHAQARSVVVEVRERGVLVIDDGVGLGRRDAGTGRHGIRRSIIERMRGIGGDASVTGVLGGGTRVELTWTSSSGADADTAEDGAGTSHFAGGIEGLERKLGVVLAGVAIADVTLQSSRVWPEPAPTPPVWAHVVLAAVIVVCALTAMLAVRRNRSTTAVLMVVAVSVSVLLCLLLPAEEMLGVQNWSVGATGWALVALGFRAPRCVTMTALGGWWLLVCATTMARVPTSDTVALLGHVTSTILCTQVLITLFAATVHRAVLVAAERDSERRTIELALAVDRVLKQECQQRYRDQLRSVVPVLRSLAEGTMSSTVVELARVEHSRLRRLFDHADRMDHWLLNDLSAQMHDMEARGVRVTAEAASGLPAISDEARASVRAAVVPLLAASATSARIVLTAEPGHLVVSVVCDAAGATSGETELRGGVESDMVVDEESETVWLRLRCPHSA
ncbi:sensor histidine kinase [Allokutzneria sp. NRRL B-24872]|uniref:sensor histidine kinase n=1 Tax=Allokutzneria sp. NRRL B-24872 TaxID=1137961 RepID=UPI000A3B3619|nr:hypothetical protein [Allokutzneria sp. NRRL B-24872]